GAFVLLYLLFVFGIGLPIMMSEVLVGRRGRRNPVTTMRLLGEEETGKSAWRFVGGLGVVTGFLILSFYSVIAGWTVAYVFESASGAFRIAGAVTVESIFQWISGNELATGAWHTLFMVVTIGVVVLGVEQGLERAVRFMMPLLIALLLVLLGYAMTSGSFI